MKIINGIKRVAKPFVNVPAWVGYGQLKENAKNISKNFKDLFIPKQPGKIETFEEAMVRLKLTEADLVSRRKEFKVLIIIFTLLGLAVFGYTCYLFYHAAFLSGIASFALTVLVFIYSFRYHFWLFQIKQRKLGCTFKEWLNSGYMGGK